MESSIFQPQSSKWEFLLSHLVISCPSKKSLSKSRGENRLQGNTADYLPFKNMPVDLHPPWNLKLSDSCILGIWLCPHPFGFCFPPLLCLGFHQPLTPSLNSDVRPEDWENKSTVLYRTVMYWLVLRRQRNTEIRIVYSDCQIKLETICTTSTWQIPLPTLITNKYVLKIKSLWHERLHDMVQHGPKQVLKVTIEKLAEKQRSTLHVSCTCRFEWWLNVEKFKSKQIQVSRPLGPWGRLEVQDGTSFEWMQETPPNMLCMSRAYRPSGNWQPQEYTRIIYPGSNFGRFCQESVASWESQTLERPLRTSMATAFCLAKHCCSPSWPWLAISEPFGSFQAGVLSALLSSRSAADVLLSRNWCSTDSA